MKEKYSSILIIGINFYPENIGIGKYTGELAFYLAKLGKKVKVITGFPYYPDWKIFKGYGNWFYKTTKVNGVSVSRCPIYVPDYLSGSKRMLQDLSFFVTSFWYLTAKMLTGKRYDLVFVVSPSFMSGFLGLYYRFFYKKSKLVYHIQDLQIDAAEELGMITRTKLLQRIKWSEGKILSKADWVSTISLGMMKKIQKKPYKINGLLIFPNWTDFEKIHKKEPDFEKVSFLGLPLENRMVLYSGAIGEKQGLEMILTAAEKAAHQIKDLFFVISGSGPYREILKKQAEEKKLSNVYFIDIQPIEIFNELLNIAWLHLVLQKDKVSDLLLPSKFSNILAVGGLALVTCSPGTTLYEVIEKNHLAVSIPPDNPNAFWDILFKMSQNNDAILPIKTAAQEYAKHNLDKEMVIHSFLNKLQ